MRKLEKEEILKRLEESKKITGYDYELTDDLKKIKVYCPKHNFSKIQNRNYAFQGRKISCCNTFSPLTKDEMDEYILRLSNQNPDCIISYDKFDGGNTLIKIHCLIHDHTRVIKYTSSKHKITEYACNRCSHEKYNRNFEYTKEKWIDKAKDVHGNTYDYSKMEDHGIHRTIICKTHGEFKQSIRNHVYYANGCPKCVVVPSISSKEHEINDWLICLGLIEGVDYIRNDRSIISPQELDFYFPKLNIALEFNGDYWHSECKKDRKYHQSKVITAMKNGVNVIMIYEHLWKTKSDIIKHRLKSLLQIQDKIYARKTEVKTISSKESIEFCNKYHLQGSCSATYHYGLFHDNELVSVMTLGKSRFTNEEYELIRLCSSINVVGGASKLLKAFIRDISPKSIVSYADLDWSIGNVYEKLGFKFESITSPSYVWVKGTKVLSRYQTQIKNENKTMRDNGFLKIYKSGSMRYTIRF